MWTPIKKILHDRVEKALKTWGVQMVRLILLGLCLFLGGCWLFKKNKWHGFHYPDRTNLTIHQMHGPFNTLEQCRKTMLRLRTGTSDFECGLNCNFESMPAICDATKR